MRLNSQSINPIKFTLFISYDSASKDWAAYFRVMQVFLLPHQSSNLVHSFGFSYRDELSTIPIVVKIFTLPRIADFFILKAPPKKNGVISTLQFNWFFQFLIQEWSFNNSNRLVRVMKGFLLPWIADFSLLKYPRSENEVFSSSTAQSQIILSLSHSGTSLQQCRLILKDNESLSLNAKSWFFFFDIPTRENYGDHYFEPSKSVNSFISRQGKGLVNFRLTARSHESLS